MPVVIHLAPQLPPAICGVGDYTALVGGKMEELQAGIRCGYVACGYAMPRERPVWRRGWRDVSGTADQGKLWEAVRACCDDLGPRQDDVALVVNYVGYGYDRTGAPHWLADALERRPEWFREGRIVTMFHELYATGWPWQRSFWHSSAQQAVATRIARASDALMTNRAASARWLERVTGRPGGSVPSLPVPSNVGEPDEVPTWETRQFTAVCFGGARFKRPFLTPTGARATAELCRRLGIKIIYVIGQSLKFNEATFRSSGIEVVQTGLLPADEVSWHFMAARLALVNYFPEYFAKSGILAAAAAHGTPAVFPTSSGASDGLRFGENIWSLPSATSAPRPDVPTTLTSLSHSIRAWYVGHNSKRHAKLVCDLSYPAAATVS